MPGRAYLPAGPRYLPPPLQAQPLTIGFEPHVGGTFRSCFIEHRFGSFPTDCDGWLDRLFMFGTPTGQDMHYDNYFANGQHQNPPHGLPGLSIAINGRRYDFSRELIAAHSGGQHLDISKVEAMATIATSLRVLAEKQEPLADACVSLGVILQGLLAAPMVGYGLSPVLTFGAQDSLEIHGVPPGCRLYMTGTLRRPVV